MEKRFLHAHLSAVKNGASQKSFDNIFFFIVSGQNIFMNRKSAGPDVICNSPHTSAIITCRVVSF